ncbi:MAG TPA: FAD-binding protein [Burkholderiales bacterium]|nr:FAD-binding protein [Burkholderiales bacterium]
MIAKMPLSVSELREAVREGRTVDTSRLNRILAIDAQRGLLEVQAATPWRAIAADMRPGDPRANVRTTMPTVGESIARNAAGPDGTPAVNHVASLTIVMPDGDFRRVSRHREPELFALAVGGQGLFGTMYSITLHIASLARAIEKQAEPQVVKLQPPMRGQQTIDLLVPPESVDAFVKETDERCNDWRVPLLGVTARNTLREEETYLRWAQREYCDLRLAIAPPRGLGGAVRTAQLRRELIDAAIAVGGSFPIASTPDATREQTETCYPQLKAFLAEKRRFDPHERVVNAWYIHQRDLLRWDSVSVRWSH